MLKGGVYRRRPLWTWIGQLPDPERLERSRILHHRWRQLRATNWRSGGRSRHAHHEQKRYEQSAIEQIQNRRRCQCGGRPGRASCFSRYRLEDARSDTDLFPRSRSFRRTGTGRGLSRQDKDSTREFYGRMVPFKLPYKELLILQTRHIRSCRVWRNGQRRPPQIKVLSFVLVFSAPFAVFLCDLCVLRFLRLM